MNAQAWNDLGLASALDLTKSQLALRANVADAILPKGVVPKHAASEKWVQVPAARVGGHLSKHWALGTWRVSDGYVVGDGLLVKMVAE